MRRGRNETGRPRTGRLDKTHVGKSVRGDRTVLTLNTVQVHRSKACRRNIKQPSGPETAGRHQPKSVLAGTFRYIATSRTTTEKKQLNYSGLMAYDYEFSHPELGLWSLQTAFTQTHLEFRASAVHLVNGQGSSTAFQVDAGCCSCDQQ